MIKKLCPTCGKVIERSLKLCEECTIKITSKRNKAYNSSLRNKEQEKVYHTKQWDIAKRQVALRDNSLCRLCFSNRSWTASQLVHHIVEVEEDSTLIYSADNLISLCESCHQQVHAEYRNGNKTELQTKLRTLTKTPVKL